MTFSSKSFSTFNDLGISRERRPARHIACPQRLKYIHNISDGYVPYVDDFSTVSHTDATYKLGLYNTNDDWQRELMLLAQQVRSTVDVQNESQQSRSSRSRFILNKEETRQRSTSNKQSDESMVTKRLFNRGKYLHSNRKLINESPDITKPPAQQDHGIWLLPILCHILHIETIAEAQQWLINANATEKRLAMELVARTMSDNQQIDFDSEWTTSEPFLSATHFARAPSSYQQRYWKPELHPVSTLVSEPNQQLDTCERATSPMRLITPARRLSATARAFSSLSRSISQASSRRTTSTLFDRRQPSRLESLGSAHRSTAIKSPNLSCRSSNESSQSIRMKNLKAPLNNEYDRSFSTLARGKIPLI